jgi:hypothetical protein
MRAASARLAYADPLYAASLAEFGRPRELQLSGGWILERAIGSSHLHDGAGPYPLFACVNWEGLGEDLEALRDSLVSVTIVTDPFGDYDEALLRGCFPHLIRPFKKHHVVDLDVPLVRGVSRHHQRNVRRALSEVSVEEIPQPVAILDEWVRLYREVCARHRVTGVARFSRQAFRKQLALAGGLVLAARVGQEIVGITIWYVRGQFGYYHLGASSATGYERRASFGLFWRAFETLAERGIRYVALGGSSGLIDQADGLARFKEGWATRTVHNYLCGRICDEASYAALSGSSVGNDRTYFPEYRASEF